MQYSVYLKSQEPSGKPSHHSPRTLALAAVSRGKAVQIGQNAIQLTTDITWRELKAWLRGYRSDRPEPINPPGYYTLPYTYPLPIEILRHYQA